MDSFFDRALAEARRLGASDVHLKPGLPPVLRINGDLRTLSDDRGERVPVLARDFLHSLAMSLLNDRRREILERTGDVTVALPSATGIRQRVHISQQRGGLGISLRLIPPEIPLLERLGLPPETRDLLAPGPGLILVASGPGGGRTTTLAAMVDDLNRRHALHIVTIEDPVEILLGPRRSMVVQREVGLDVPTTAAGLRAASRHDADIIMVGDLGESDAAELALAAAETGRLVLAGMSAPSAASVTPRLVSLWPAEQRAAADARVGAVLRGILHQRLVQSGKGRRTAEAELLRGVALAPGDDGKGEKTPAPDAARGGAGSSGGAPVEDPPAGD
jgi:twitching motility protein PilT